MTEPAPEPFGESVLVSLGWYVTVIGALLLGLRQTDTGHTCDDATSWCFTPSAVAGIGAVLAVPAIAVMTGISALISRPMVRSGLSAPVAGTAAAAAASVVFIVMALVALVAR
ncbi:hypothetical protein FB565_003505 [Actinoplanes lutulentus]|uniref:Uncharacterized protein n=1 Tax=Actinoplanes lutulentus TaxID=1287878 RepID=A0A327ZB03_9ACTN|nr:hypothetical protein [Actinoplanes lutulentus]MBB2943776.1 hypothetical protein [Actinoplanes lutulentus]RAK29318.1 hypothetical protein B0I29_118110 [Actinoplanes lutulentus]